MSLHESPFDRDQDSQTRRSTSYHGKRSRRPAGDARPSTEPDDDPDGPGGSPSADTGGRAVSALTSTDRSTDDSPPVRAIADENSSAAVRLYVGRDGKSRVSAPDHEMLSRLGRPRDSDRPSRSTGSLSEFAFTGGRESAAEPARDPACDQPSGYLASSQ